MARLGRAALLLSLLILGGPADAEPVTHADRESSYPAGVDNVTHAPWDPDRGDDVAVTMTLDAQARIPDKAHLVYCRVEPEYVCAAPREMASSEEGIVWTGTVPWDDRFMKEDTVHIGYSVIMRHLDRSGEVERVTAPTGNYWVPPTYPEETGDNGTYFFFAYGPDAARAPAPAPGPFLWVLPLLVLAVAARASGRGGRHGR